MHFRFEEHGIVTRWPWAPAIIIFNTGHWHATTCNHGKFQYLYITTDIFELFVTEMAPKLAKQNEKTEVESGKADLVAIHPNHRDELKT